MTLARLHILPLALLIACGDKETEDTGDAVDTTPDTPDTTPETGPVDADGDGYDEDADCDDADAAVHPDAAEVCDDIDNDCDGLIDADDDDIEDAGTWYIDADGDGHGSDEAVTACAAPADAVADALDCDDADAAIHPDAAEICDGIDNNCDDAIDGAGLVTWLGDDGSWLDLSADFAADSTAPLALTLDAPGELALCEGAYYAHLSLQADAAVTGYGEVTLSGASTDTIVRIETEGTSASLRNLTLTEGLATTQRNGYEMGGALLCAGASTVQLTDVDVVRNTAYMAAGLALFDGCATDISGGTFSENNATATGGSIYIEDGSATITDTAFFDSYGAAGGGVGMGAGELTITDAWFEGHTGNAGSALYLSSGVVASIQGTTFHNNTAGSSFAGAIWAFDGVELDISESTFSENSASLAGGAVGVLSSCTLTLSETTFESNSGGLLGGGAFYVDTTSTIEGESVDFIKNSPDDIYGGYTFGEDTDFSCSGGSCE